VLESRLRCPWLVNGKSSQHSDAAVPETPLPAASGLILANMIVDEVAGLVFGILASLVYAVLLTDLRGLATAHVRRSIRSAQPLLRIPPWRWLPAFSDAGTFRFGMLVERLGGAMFVVAGLTIAVSSVRHLRG